MTSSDPPVPVAEAPPEGGAETAPPPSAPEVKADKEKAAKAEKTGKPGEVKEGGDKEREDKAAKKKKKKEERLRRDAHRPLDSWERYRALTDTLDEARDLVDLADHKARFALVIMAALNAGLFILATRTEFVDAIPADFRPWIGAYLVVYALVAVYFFMQAIESLRPRKATPHVPYPGEIGFEDHPVGLRFYEDTLRRDLEAYRRAWREVRIGQLNAELAVQAHTLAHINRAKYRALQRLYLGLQVMTLMAAGLITLAAYTVFTAQNGGAVEPALKPKGAKHARAALDVLGTPERLAASGAKEPSGVAYHAGLGRLFVVGDEGRLVELDLEGSVLRTDRLRGNLEDVAVHTPSGHLLLLSEKRSEVIFYDPAAREERRRWRIDPVSALGQEPADRNRGFEGVAFREDPLSPGGGVFYLVHQGSPAMIVALAFDPDRPAGLLGPDVVIGRWSLKGHKDLSAVAYAPVLERLLVVADAKDRLLVLRTDGLLEAEVGLPGVQQEGLCLDAQGTLWVADERRGLLRFRGALQALEAHLTEAVGVSGAAPAAGADKP